MAGYVLNAHRNAQLNPYAVWNGRQITYEDYINSRLIAYPMCVFDNDMPVDGVQAVVMTTEDRAKDTPHPGGYISGIARHTHAPQQGRRSRLAGGAGGDERLAGEEPVRERGRSPGGRRPEARVRRLQPDGLGCGWRRSGSRRAARRTRGASRRTSRWEGPHPLNTAGGNLGNGRIHGMTNVWETANQMMGTAGPRQLPRPDGELKKLDVALCETGPFGSASSFICTRE